MGRRKGKGKDHAKIGGDKNNESVGCCSSSLVPNTDEAMSASSAMAQEMKEAKSEASWTALVKEKERDWWSVDLEGEVEEAGGRMSLEDHSMDPEGEMNHNSDGKTLQVKKRKLGNIEGR